MLPGSPRPLRMRDWTREPLGFRRLAVLSLCVPANGRAGHSPSHGTSMSGISAAHRQTERIQRTAKANRRMIPTRYFKDPDIMNVRSKDIQLILIGLVLTADDEGRELAHAGLLGREMDYAPEQIEAALQELVANDLLLLYEVGRHRYYSLTRWSQWQTLGSKMTASKYP